MFLMPGLVSPELPAGFAVPTAYDDLTVVILALLALASLRYEAAFAVPMLWLFNLVGLLDLIYANIATFKHHVDPVHTTSLSSTCRPWSWSISSSSLSAPLASETPPVSKIAGKR
jgi:hypothetical protein